MKKVVWKNYGVVERVVDGGTIYAMLSLGYNVRLRVSIRLEGLNAPELHKLGEKRRGAAALAFLSALLPVGTQILVESHKLDLFGRSQAVVWRGADGDGDGGKSLNDLLLENPLFSPMKKQ